MKRKLEEKKKGNFMIWSLISYQNCIYYEFIVEPSLLQEEEEEEVQNNMK